MPKRFAAHRALGASAVKYGARADDAAHVNAVLSVREQHFPAVRPSLRPGEAGRSRRPIVNVGAFLSGLRIIRALAVIENARARKHLARFCGEVIADIGVAG
jgi:hypothetical protein